MRVPQAILTEIQAALRDHLGHDPGQLNAAPVGGGCISPAVRVQGAVGDVCFLKWAEQPEMPGIFEFEARAFEAIRKAQAVRVQEVIALGGGGGGWRAGADRSRELLRTS